MKKRIIVSLSFLLVFSLQIYGQTWSALKRLTWDGCGSFRPAVAANTGSKVHVVWEDDNAGQAEIYYKRSTNGGTAWQSRVRLTWNPGFSIFPSIAADPVIGIHIAWNDNSPGNYEIFYKQSTDSGSSWSALKRLTWNSGGSSHPYITADSGSGIHIVWTDNTPSNEEIFYKKSTDSGVTWSGLTRLTWNIGQSKTPAIAADTSSGLHVVWYDDSPLNWEIFYKRSTDGGDSWSPPTRLSWNNGISTEPIIAADSTNGVHVVWFDDSLGNWEIFYKRSTDSGSSWSALMRMTWNTGVSGNPFICSDSGTGVHIVWADTTPLNRELFYKQSTDSGTTWSGLTRLTWNSGVSENPAVTTNPLSGINVVWYDNSPGNFEIFYKNGK